MSIFSSVQGAHLKKNKFNLSHDNMLACEHGQIVPCYIQENIIPGSSLKINQATLMRYQALLAPLQHHVNAFVHFWWIPTRLVDKDFTKFISGQFMREDGIYNPPYFTYKGVAEALGELPGANMPVKNGTLMDFLGYPIPQDCEDWGPNDWAKCTEKMSIRRFQYYLMPIYFKYINENIQFHTKQDVNFLEIIKNFCIQSPVYEQGLHGDVSFQVAKLLWFLQDLNSSYLMPHAWQKDYFTSALPFVQLGDPVTLPLGGSAPVAGNITINNPVLAFNDVTNTADELAVAAGKAAHQPVQIKTKGSVADLYTIHGEVPNNTLEADLSEATAITINELRIANALQSLKEAYARFGTRFNEWLEGFWGVKPDDQSLQMPLWLGGGKIPVNIADIEQKSATLSNDLTGSTTPLGTLGGKGTGFGTFKAVNAYFKEPGCVIGLLFVQPKPVYGNTGLNRFITKLDNIYDFFNPKTEHLGEQAVLSQELYYNPDNHNADTFGYQSRYAEYKFMPSEIHGQFMDVLNFWHMARIFNTRPTLSKEFIYTQLADTKRPFAVQSVEVGGEDIDISSCLIWLHFEVEYIAPMSRFGSPMLLN